MQRPSRILRILVRRWQSHVDELKSGRTNANFQQKVDLKFVNHRHLSQQRCCHSSQSKTELPTSKGNLKIDVLPKSKEKSKSDILDENISTQFVPSLSRRVIVDPASVKQVFYFDTLSYVRRLEQNGCSREQAEGITECFTDIIHSTIDYQSRNMTTKPQQEILTQQLLAEISAIKKDMVILQKSEFTALKHETDKLSVEIKMLRETLDDEMGKVKGQVKLDINLERGRAIEAHAENEKELAKLHNKIDTGIANLKTMFEQYRNDMFKYAGGTVLAMASLSVALLRFLS